MRKLSLLILIMLLPLLASADVVEIDGIFYELITEDNTAEVAKNTSTYSGNVVIPESVKYEGTTYKVTSIGDYAFLGSEIISVTIPNSVISIGDNAFVECSGLTSVTIPNSVTTIGRSAFAHCNSLTSLVIPNSVNNVGDYAFGGCTNLTKVSFHCCIIGDSWISECENLTELIFGDEVTEIEEDAFSDFENLESITLGTNIIKAEDAFSNCVGLKKIVYNCKNLKTLFSSFLDFIPKDIQLFIGPEVTSVSSLIYIGCTSIKVDSNNQTFDSRDDCNAIIETESNKLIKASSYTVIPQSVTGIGAGAFYGFHDVTISIPENVTNLDKGDGRGNIRDVLSGCNNIKLEIHTKEIGRSWFSGGSSCITELVIGDEVESIGEMAFAWRFDINSIVVGKGIKNVSSSAFSDNKGLNKVTFHCPKLGYWFLPGVKDVTIGDEVTEISDYFMINQDSLKSIYIGTGLHKIDKMKWETLSHSNLEKIEVNPDNKFFDSRDDCNALIETEDNNLILGCKNTIIPNNITTISNNAFGGCNGLTAITIPKSVTSIAERAFYCCNDLSFITIEVDNPVYDSRRNCNAIIRTEDNTLIHGCKNTIIPSNVIKIGDNAFSGCSGLTDITIPYSVTSIGVNAFHGCGITSLTIPQSVVSIGGFAFGYCSNLTTVNLPNSVTSIGDNVFRYCSNLTSVNSEITEPFTISSNVFDPETYSKSTLYVPIGTKEKYETTDGWKEFQTIMEKEPYQKATCAEVIAGADETIYVVTGRVGSIVNTTYGNWYLEDETGQIYIYGTVDANGNWPKDSSWESFGINEGDMITVLGPKTTYQGTTELVNVKILKPVTVMSLTSDNNVSEWTNISLANIKRDATDITIDLYCDGDYEINIPEEAKSWLTVKSKTNGNWPHVVLHADANESALRQANVVFSTIKDGQKYEAKIQISQQAYQFTATTPEGVEMQFRVTADNNNQKTCSVGTGETYTCAIDPSTSGHITIPTEVKGFTVTAISTHAFYDCQGLTDVTLPETITIINYEAFLGCSQLSTINFPDACEAIGDSNFEGTPWFENQPDGIVYTGRNLYVYKGEMPEGTSIDVKEGCVSIGYAAFKNQKNLVAITLPESMKNIQGYAFFETGIKEITIPANVEYIVGRAFCGCTNLEEVIFMGLTDEIRNGTFSRCPNLKKIVRYSAEPSRMVSANAFYYRFEDKTDDSIYERTTICVPIGAVESYKKVSPWSLFKNINEMDIEPVKEGEKVDFGEGCGIIDNTDLNGKVVENVYYNIGTDAGGYSSEDGCIVITKETSEEQMAALEGLCITDEELKQNFTGIIFKVPAGNGKVTVTAETKGNMTLKVKVGKGETMEMELSGKLKMKVPYNVTEESLVYIFAGTTNESAARGVQKAPEEQSLKIYDIEWEQTIVKGDANGDGAVNTEDIVVVVNYLMGNQSDDFKFDGADTNNDGVVNIADIVGIVNIITGN